MALTDEPFADQPAVLSFEEFWADLRYALFFLVPLAVFGVVLILIGERDFGIPLAIDGAFLVSFGLLVDALARVRAQRIEWRRNLSSRQAAATRVIDLGGNAIDAILGAAGLVGFDVSVPEVNPPAEVAGKGKALTAKAVKESIDLRALDPKDARKCEEKAGTEVDRLRVDNALLTLRADAGGTAATDAVDRILNAAHWIPTWIRDIREGETSQQKADVLAWNLKTVLTAWRDLWVGSRRRWGVPVTTGETVRDAKEGLARSRERD